MIYNITHITDYKFNKTVFLEPHIIRLIPRSDPVQTLKKFSIRIQPKEAGSSSNLDLDGNNTITAWFNDTHDNLKIKTSSSVELLNSNPFDYIFTDLEAIKLPIKYDKDHQKQLAPYILLQSKPSKNMVEFAKNIREESDNGTIRFLGNLCTGIHRSIERVDRETGEPMTPHDTLKERQGSCRDLAVLFMESCRLFGLAARFVSGYLTESDDNGNFNLHAWAEVYIPGAGWRGYDPSTGFVVSGDHIALASGFNSLMAAPVFGYFRGNDIEPVLSYDISIKAGT